MAPTRTSVRIHAASRNQSGCFPTGFRILISQMTQDRDVHIVFGKALGALGHAELFEPVLSLLHGGHPTVSSGHDRVFDHRDREFIPILSAIAPPFTGTFA